MYKIKDVEEGESNCRVGFPKRAWFDLHNLIYARRTM